MSESVSESVIGGGGGGGGGEKGGRGVSGVRANVGIAGWVVS